MLITNFYVPSKSKGQMSLSVKSLFTILLVFITMVAVSQTSTISDGDWNTGGNWDAGVPGGGDVATIQNNMTLDVNIAIGNGGDYTLVDDSISDPSGGGAFDITLTGSGNFDVGGNVTVEGDLTLRNSSRMIIRSGDTVRIGGNALFRNTIDFEMETGSVLIIDGDMDMENSSASDIDGQILVKGDLTTKNSASISGNGNIEVEGTVDINNSSNVFGSTSDCDPGPCELGTGFGLPIELIEFGAEYIGINLVELKWTTASEINNEYFLIEFSTDGHNFYEVERVSGAGNSNKIIDYNIVHMPGNHVGLVYYRLTQVDFDGQKETFPLTVAKQSQFIREQINLFPNPSSKGNKVFIELKNVPLGVYQVELMDAKGVPYYKSMMQIDESVLQSKINLFETNSFPKGAYLLRITGQSRMITEKLIIQ